MLKINYACHTVSLSLQSEYYVNNPKKNQENREISLDDSYDVFISYSHKDISIANKIVSQITKTKPTWRVFIDQSGLRAGSAWQSKLYIKYR